MIDWGGGSLLRALLGPTNTGKTHRAIERMLFYGSGMIGLPLRLLAREIYDRLCARVGVEQVALVTGEERIVPVKAKLYVCTTESMLTNKDFPFVAIDEIQLATHPKRGHVFTDRLLHMRGTRETWFMGSDRMIPIMRRLIPTVEIETHERLSSLKYGPPRTLTALPPRTAVVAFSMAHVYDLAERLRAAKGGVAVVLGALSPGVRNAQVELFQSGAVRYLVATDAIGMGLNLDIRQVAFGALRKFDGVEYRRLEPYELGQIAGRAGRHHQDGVFHLTEDCALREYLPEGHIAAVENHQFLPIRRIYYRNSDLDYTSPESLWHSLHQRPFASCLVPAFSPTDELSLEALLEDPGIQKRIESSPEHLALLWEVCQIPDYRQDSEKRHLLLLQSIFRQLTQNHCVISDKWFEQQISKLNCFEGKIATMMRRITFSRTLAYISHREDWLEEPGYWRKRVLELEDKLSSSMHEKLTHRFIDDMGPLFVGRPVPDNIRLEGNNVLSDDMGLGRIEAFSFVPDPAAETLFGVRESRKYARKWAVDYAQELASELLEEEAPVFQWDERIRLCWKGQPVGQLKKGLEICQPQLKILSMDLLEPSTRKQLEGVVRDSFQESRRLLDEHLRHSKAKGALAGLLYFLRSRLGVVPRHEAREQLRSLRGWEKKILGRLKVVVGRYYIYSRPLLRPSFQAMRAAFWAVHYGKRTLPELPGARVSAPLLWGHDFGEDMGYLRIGPRIIRVDMFERIVALLRNKVSSRPSKIPQEPMQWIGCTRDEWGEILRAMGYRFHRDGILPPRSRRR